ADHYGIGIGAADIQIWHEDAGGYPGVEDKNYYMVLEGFEGSALCRSYTHTTIAIARAASIAGPWYVQDHPLLGRKEGCGRDMPAWWYDKKEHAYKVVLTTTNGTGSKPDLQRITLANQYRP